MASDNVEEISIQVLPESFEYSQIPCVTASASLEMIATPLKEFPSTSLNKWAKSRSILSPPGETVSSKIAANAGDPLATGASLTLTTSAVGEEVTDSTVPPPSV